MDVRPGMWRFGYDEDGDEIRMMILAVDGNRALVVETFLTTRWVDLDEGQTWNKPDDDMAAWVKHASAERTEESPEAAADRHADAYGQGQSVGYRDGLLQALLMVENDAHAYDGDFERFAERNNAFASINSGMKAMALRQVATRLSQYAEDAKREVDRAEGKGEDLF